MDKKELQEYLENGLSTRDIEKIVGLNHRTISYWISKYGLNDFQKYKKNHPFRFEKIDSKEKAYALGFILADGSISNEMCEISIAVSDKEVLEFISSVVNGNVTYDYTYDKKARRFPRARLSKKIPDINKFIGGDRKSNRHYPIVKNDLERYLLQGVFEADGCITWGYRKDKNRLWCRFSVKSSYKILEGLQKVLLKKVNVGTIIHPVRNENCYVIEVSGRDEVKKILDFIYPDNSFIVLKRKYLKQKALRLELGENEENL